MVSHPSSHLAGVAFVVETDKLFGPAAIGLLCPFGVMVKAHNELLAQLRLQVGNDSVLLLGGGICRINIHGANLAQMIVDKGESNR